MTTKNTGGPAFPVAVPVEFQFANDGMTLRDWFAGQAMLGLLADATRQGSMEELARVSFAAADAMLAEREK